MKKSHKNLLVLSALVLVVTGCDNKKPPEEVKYTPGNEDVIYDSVLSEFNVLATEAKKIVDDDERYVKYAEAEAALLDSAVFVPNTTQGGAYTVSRVAPRTIPYVVFGNDEDRLKHLVLVAEESQKTFIKGAERAEMISLWQAAREGGAAYDPAAYLTEKGYKLNRNYQTTFQTAPATLDSLNTSEQSDTEVLVNMVEGLVEYDNYGVLHGQLAIEQEDGRPYILSEDGKTYTFKLREDAYWYTNEGQQYAPVVADDFVASFQHMLDAGAGLDFLVDGIVEGAHEYLNGGKFSDVGVKALDAHTFEIKLCNPESFFISRLTYSCFMPMSRAKFLAEGGQFGIEEFKAAQSSDSYHYGLTSDLSTMVYNGPFYPTAFDSTSQIKLSKNEKYFDASKVTLDSITWIADSGENPTALYEAAMNGTYAGVALTASTGLLAQAQAEPNNFFETYNYVSDTTSTTYFAGLNVNRTAFQLANGNCKSNKTDAESIAYFDAVQNINFRKAIAAAWDRKTWNSVTRGKELGATNLRNMYCAPNFVSLGKDVTVDGHTFTRGTEYGSLVQYFSDKRGNYIKVADGQDGYYNPEKAVEFLNKAKEELGSKWAGPVKIDVVYYTAAQAYIAQAQSVKALIEGVLGTDNVVINLIPADVKEDYYAAGYRCASGKELPQDLFYGSGWGPDYADPSSYLDTFTPSGYMCKIIGLY